MKSIRSSMLFKVFVLAVGALGASAGSAHAQSRQRDSSLSTHETRWGGVVLPPGDYTFSLQSPSLPAQIMVRQSRWRSMAIVLPQAVSTRTTRRGQQTGSQPNRQRTNPSSARCIWEIWV